MNMTALIKSITFIWLLWWTTLSVRRLLSDKKASIDIVMLVFFIFCGVPLLLDVTIGEPEYTNQPGFSLASQDALTNYIYCLYMAFIPPFWRFVNRWVQGGRQDSKQGFIEIRQSYAHHSTKRPIVRISLAVLLISPIVVAAMSPDYMQYLTYAQVSRDSQHYRFSDWHSIVSTFAAISVSAGAYVVLISRARIISFTNILAVYPFILAASWLTGKRAIIALSIFLMITIGWLKGEYKGRNMIFALFFGLFLLVGSSYVYQQFTGRIADKHLYENIRIDFGRDDVVKMAIYAELNPNHMEILEYRGQSILFYATMAVPRELWPEKPLPYAQYVTSAMFFSPPKLWGWGMTTSILDEAIANAGWTGMVFGPMLVILICCLGDRSASLFVRMLTPLVCVLLLTVQLVAYAPLFLLWLGTHIFSGLSRRGNIRGCVNRKQAVYPSVIGFRDIRTRKEEPPWEQKTGRSEKSQGRATRTWRCGCG